MRYYVLLTLIAGAAFAAASLLAAGSSAAIWAWRSRSMADATARTRARIIAILRLAPVAAGAAAAAATASAFLRFEPADTTEAPGALLVALAAFTSALALAAARRSAVGLRASARCAQLVGATGTKMAAGDGSPIWVVDTEYPVAAVTGLFRTRVLLSTRIIAECTSGEVEAIVGHERAHVRRRDNQVRAAMLYLPNPLAVVAAGRSMEMAWAAAAEEAADDAAAGDACERRTLLASALVRVARMANTPLPEWVPGLAFYEGTHLENRVHRLLDAGGAPSRLPVGSALVIAGFTAAVGVALTETAAAHLHAWMELAVRVVP